ncbi:MAG: dTDP-4-dehydrorhamnose 3,5-epimerase [Candidatus Omnitrophica bacterium CG1_02_46_14]|nr:MAG: dTDP-4-dehydrorhamnose 3,5-epimerase [Candidatus Omnitrophica bacterium CG1_02_46_14]
MNVITSKLDGILIIEPKVFGDNRGFFMESYNHAKFAEIGIDLTFVQDNHSRSARGVVRGLHYQINPGQDKLVRVIRGSVFDVVVDIRRKSPTFGRWEGFYLSEENRKQVFVPKGFAHGFCVTSEMAEFEYKCSEYYSPQDERGIIWNDPEIGVKWPVAEPILSQRDLKLPRFRDIAADF